MLYLFTGPTGSGKTALMVSKLSKIKDRPIFVMGIPDLAIEHFPVPPVEQWTEMRPDPDDPSQQLPYFTFPTNSIVVLDEGQRIYRPRPTNSAVPPHVAAFETHRHTGVDFWVATQHPTFIDAHVRKLVRGHFHIHETPLSNYLLEFPKYFDVDSSTDRDKCAKTKYKPPKEAFGLYKSAEAHTKHKKKIPGYVWLFFAAVVAAVVAWLYIGKTIFSKFEGQTAQISHLGDQRPSMTPQQGGRVQVALTPEQYIEARKPRIEGLPHTAPIFDKVTEPKRAPYPAACVQWEKKGCRCFSQQGTRLVVPEPLCAQIVQHGFFVEWDEGGEAGRVSRTQDGAHVQRPLTQDREHEDSRSRIIADSGSYGGVPPIR